MSKSKVQGEGDDIQRDTRAIWKYQLRIEDVQDIEMPRNAIPLCVDVTEKGICMWVEVDTKNAAHMEKRRFYVVGTGHPMPKRARAYIGTFQLSGGDLVFHVFSQE